MGPLFIVPSRRLDAFSMSVPLICITRGNQVLKPEGFISSYYPRIEPRISGGSPSSDAFDDDDESRPESFMASSPVTGKNLPFPSEFNYSDSDNDNDDDSMEEITVYIESRSRIYGATPDSGWVGDSEQTSISGHDDRLGESRKDSMKISIDLDKSSKVKQRPVSSFVERRLYRDKLKPNQQILSDAEIRDITEKEDLHIAFNEAYHRYQKLSSTPITPGNIHQKNDVKFDDNWHERYIERHMLLRMQKELRAHEAALKRKQKETEDRNKRRLLLGLNDFDEDYQDTRQYYQQTSPAHREIPLQYRHIRQTPHAPQTTPTNSRPHTALPAFRRLNTMSHSDNSSAKRRPKTATSYRDRDPKLQEAQKHYSDRNLFNEGRELVGSVPRSPYEAKPTHLTIYKDGDTNKMSRTQSSMSKKSQRSSKISGPQTGVDFTRYDQQEQSKTPSKIDPHTDKILKHMSHYQSEMFDDVDFEDRINTPYRFAKQGKDPVPNMKLQKLKTAIDSKQIDPRNPEAMRPKSSKSIPSKCSQYVLLSKPKEKSLYPLPTPLEEQLLAERFPMLGNKVYEHFEGMIVRHRKPEYNIDYSPFARELYG
ncbi:hypothetical protein LOTGIDRAFT_164697 [Lottia gigantea]|uniref:Uncharacterized protein n=1 Tax=Lottia gigantea TaxID=225164 RepID=V4A029_LOTGI|nr:hypothetical protein LOTGIDRAFT_164697 [Lottia gigantea]ESO89997.1 hypothetical protein LOTGIDRAFT_164697 [Lottia gigantea]